MHLFQINLSPYAAGSNKYTERTNKTRLTTRCYTMRRISTDWSRTRTFSYNPKLVPLTWTFHSYHFC